MPSSTIIPNFLQVISTAIQAQIKEDAEGIPFLLDKKIVTRNYEERISAFDKKFVIIIKRIASFLKKITATEQKLQHKLTASMTKSGDLPFLKSILKKETVQFACFVHFEITMITTESLALFSIKQKKAQEPNQQITNR